MPRGTGNFAVMERASRPSRFDLLVAILITGAAVAEALTTSKYDVVAELPLAIAFAAPLLWRRVHPLPVALATMVVLSIQRLAFGEIWDTGSSLAVPMVSVFAVAAYAGLAPAVVGLLVSVVTMSVADIGDGGDGSDYAFITLLYTALWIAGRALQRQRALVSQVRDQARQLEQAQVERELLAVGEERTRIARELHDVVAHSVSTIVVQAEAGQALIDRAPERATGSFVAIQETGRQALEELRTMLGVLREDPSGPQLAPQPRLGHLDALLASVRSAGLDVTLDVSGDPRALPTALDLSAYRIVQEALTNTIKHAHATRARVGLTYAEEHVDIQVSDNGRGCADHESSPGHGLLGIQERARLHGGDLGVETSTGGFTVNVRLRTA